MPANVEYLQTTKASLLRSADKPIAELVFSSAERLTRGRGRSETLTVQMEAQHNGPSSSEDYLGNLAMDGVISNHMQS